MVWQGYEPKEWEDTDVDIEVSGCGRPLAQEHILTSSRSLTAASADPTCTFSDQAGEPPTTQWLLATRLLVRYVE